MKLLNQGAYGCVFQPGFNCTGAKESTKKYLTKIQKKKNTSDKETRIGALVQKTSAYTKYFAPIIETCDVDLTKVKDDELQKCDFVDLQRMQSARFETNKIRYVGSKTLAEYFHDKTQHSGSTFLFFKQFIHSYTILMEAVRKLAAANIIHFDLKENNIMCRAKTGRPIIIDFGLSIYAENIASENFQPDDAFFTYGPDYPPWCIDICFLTYIVELGKTKDDWATTPITPESWNPVIQDFIRQNAVFTEMLTKEETETFQSTMSTYFQTMVDSAYYGTPTWKTVYDAFIAGWKTWDSYSIAVIYLQMMKQFHLDKYATQVSFVDQFLRLLKDVVLATPDKRPVSDEIIASANNIFSKVPKKEAKNLQNDLLVLFKNKVLYNEREKTLAASKLQTRKREDRLYGVLNNRTT